MINVKKSIIAPMVALPMLLATDLKSFELPEKFPYGEISANVSFFSQYVWRGEQQNAGQSAIQGGFDWGVTLLDTYVDAYAGIWGSNVSGGTNSLSGNELDYYAGISGAIPGLEDFLSYDGGVLYYDYPGMTDQNTADGARNADFVEYYGSIGATVPAGITDVGISYYYGYSPAGFQQGNYDYQNIGIEFGVPSTPFTLSGSAGFTGADDEGGNQYTDYMASISTSAFGLDWGLSYTTVEGYGADQEIDQVIWSVGAGF